MAEKRREGGSGGGVRPGEGSSEPNREQGERADEPPGDAIEHAPAKRCAPIGRFVFKKHAKTGADDSADYEMHNHAERGRFTAGKPRDPVQAVDGDDLRPEDQAADESSESAVA